MLDFPSNPNTGQVYSPGAGLPSWKWDGEKWVGIGVSDGGGGGAAALSELSDVTLVSLQNSQTLVWNGTHWANYGGFATDTSVDQKVALGYGLKVPIAFATPSTSPFIAATTLTVAITMPLIIPANLAGSVFYAAIEATANTTYTLFRGRGAGYTNLGNIVFNAGQTGGVTAGIGTDTACVAGDTLRLSCAADATLAGLSITIQATRA